MLDVIPVKMKKGTCRINYNLLQKLAQENTAKYVSVEDQLRLPLDFVTVDQNRVLTPAELSESFIVVRIFNQVYFMVIATYSQLFIIIIIFFFCFTGSRAEQL